VEVPGSHEDADRYEKFFREAGPRLWRMAYVAAGGRRQIAEDAIAEAFARAMERGGLISNPVAWIHTTALRLVIDEFRRERRERGLRDREHRLPAIEGPEPGVVTRDRLFRAMAKISPQQRAVLVLKYTEDLSTQEIAGLLGMSASTVRVHLHRARRKLAGTYPEANDE